MLSLWTCGGRAPHRMGQQVLSPFTQVAAAIAAWAPQTRADTAER